MATISSRQMGKEGLNPQGRSYVKHDNIHYSQGLRLNLGNGKNMVQKWKSENSKDYRARDSLVVQTVQSACNAGDLDSISGSERFPGEGNGNQLQCSCLENPIDRRAWQATVHGVAKGWTQLSDFTFTSFFTGPGS